MDLVEVRHTHTSLLLTLIYICVQPYFTRHAYHTCQSGLNDVEGLPTAYCLPVRLIPVGLNVQPVTQNLCRRRAGRSSLTVHSTPTYK
jgi:hypothetical protein